MTEHGFTLDRFQIEAIEAWDRGESLLVAAPTGSGKTVVAEHAIDTALGRGRRAFYTAPIKALSNQKYHDLAARLGADRVGLLTGDNAINGDADVVVMTTEVLRNMIYGRNRSLADLDVVVLDEVHFLQDAYRGPVWEEVIIHLPTHVRLVCLSATVSNSKEFAAWVSTVRGPTAAIVEQRRPVQLDNLYMIGDRTHDRIHVLATLIDGRPNPDAVRIDGEGARPGRGRDRRPHARRRLYTPWRIDVIEHLAQRGMLPAIYFIFSRNQCEEAAATALDAGLRLTTPDEREQIQRILAERLGALDDDDLEVLGYPRFAAQLEAGIAAHHAGMVTPFKEAVEACFIAGLVKVVFATETLAVGINMPAKTVVIDKLTKFTGEHHSFLSPGEYTQLTGRAGRRGLDEQGYAIVLWSPFVSFEQVAMLASSRTFHLNSAFRPTYNMAANLVRTYTSAQAHHLLNQSFAQFQADRQVVTLETRLAERRAQLEELRAAAHSPFGDIDEFRTAAPPGPGGTALDAVSRALVDLRPGEVIYAEKKNYLGRVAVLSTAWRKGGMRLTGVTAAGGPIQLTAEDFAVPPRAVGAIRLPDGFAPQNPAYQRQVAELLAGVAAAGGPVDADTEYVMSPVRADPDLDQRLKAATRADRIEREIDGLRRRMEGHGQSIAADFDRVLKLLADWGYVAGWELTEAGSMLARTFHECDLLVVECLRRGLFDGLGPDTLAGLVSVFVYEHRSPDDPPAPWFPTGEVHRRWREIAQISYTLQGEEERRGLAVHRPPDPTFVAVAFAWAAGEGFAEVVGEEELSGGDFVRTTKQLIDLLRQIALVATEAGTRRSAAQAAESLFRGVVAASSAVEAPA